MGKEPKKEPKKKPPPKKQHECKPHRTENIGGAVMAWCKCGMKMQW